jgi:hypothetical protein
MHEINWILSQMDANNETITCWNIDPYLSFLGAPLLGTILIIMPISAGGNLLSLQYWISIFEYVGPLGFILCLGLWGILIYYMWPSENTFGRVVFTEQIIYLHKLFSLTYEINWSDVSEFEIKKSNNLALELVISTMQGKKIECRFFTEKDPTEEILRMRELAEQNE